MIARVWHGVAPESKASECIACVQQELLQSYLKAPGNNGAFLLSRSSDGCIELLVLSLWESASFLQALTGPDVGGTLAVELMNPSPMVKNFEVLVSHLPDQH